METPIAEALSFGSEVANPVPHSANVPVRVVREENIPVVVVNCD